jgi:hypothetical protein
VLPRQWTTNASNEGDEEQTKLDRRGRPARRGPANDSGDFLAIQESLNNRPCKTLGYLLKPSKRLAELVALAS